MQRTDPNPTGLLQDANDAGIISNKGSIISRSMYNSRSSEDQTSEVIMPIARGDNNSHLAILVRESLGEAEDGIVRKRIIFGRVAMNLKLRLKLTILCQYLYIFGPETCSK